MTYPEWRQASRSMLMSHPTETVTRLDAEWSDTVARRAWERGMRPGAFAVSVALRMAEHGK
jgi:hypothetical protein